MLDASAMTQSEVADVVMRLMAQHMKTESEGWTLQTELAEIGIDSFDFVEFVFLIEDEFGIEIEYNANDMSKSLTTIGAVADAIRTVTAKTAAGGRSRAIDTSPAGAAGLGTAKIQLA